MILGPDGKPVKTQKVEFVETEFDMDRKRWFGLHVRGASGPGFVCTMDEIERGAVDIERLKSILIAENDHMVCD